MLLACDIMCRDHPVVRNSSSITTVLIDTAAEPLAHDTIKVRVSRTTQSQSVCEVRSRRVSLKSWHRAHQESWHMHRQHTYRQCIVSACVLST